MLLTDCSRFPATPRQGQIDLPPLLVRCFGLQDYEPVWQAMRSVVAEPHPGQADELWLLSHRPVFTQGQAGKSRHLLDPGDIPVVQADRGGQVTYHGPGQLVVYPLLDIRRRKLGVKSLVQMLQCAVIHTLEALGISAVTRPGAPGVYVNDAKIAAVGLRISNGWSYHGLSLNVNMDLQPFSRINPCGFAGLAVTQVADLVSAARAGETANSNSGLLRQTGRLLIDRLLYELGYATGYG